MGEYLTYLCLFALYSIIFYILSVLFTSEKEIKELKLRVDNLEKKKQHD